MRFKSVSFRATITHKDTSQTVAKQLQSLIDTHATEGWVFEKLETVEAFSAASGGCFGIGATPALVKYFPIAVFSYPNDVENPSISDTPRQATAWVNSPQETETEVENAILRDPEPVIVVADAEPVEPVVISQPSSYANLFDVSIPETVVQEANTFSETLDVSESNTPKLTVMMDWVKQNKVIVGAFIAIGVILLVYQFVIRPANAKKDGIRMAEVVCGCEIAKTNALINRLQDFDRNFAAYNFQIQSEARVAYDNLLSNKTLACEAGVKALTEQNMLQYNYQNEQLYSYYQDGFNQGSQSCGNVQERNRLKNQIEQRINYLPVELLNQTVATSENTFRTALGYNTGTLIIEASVLNVRDRPHKEEGSIVFKVQNGMQFNYTQQFTDERGITWYNIESEGVSGWVSGLFTYLQNIEATINVPQTYFYDVDNTTLTLTKRRQYLELNQTAKIFKKMGDFVYTEYTNTQGITTKGWLLEGDLK